VDLIGAVVLVPYF
jgi:hypothetical protein